MDKGEGFLRAIFPALTGWRQNEPPKLGTNILEGEMTILPFSGTDSSQGINEQLLREYAFFLAKKSEGTIEAYLRTVRQVMTWIAERSWQ